jgi:hypothetical protein
MNYAGSRANPVGCAAFVCPEIGGNLRRVERAAVQSCSTKPADIFEI